MKKIIVILSLLILSLGANAVKSKIEMNKLIKEDRLKFNEINALKDTNIQLLQQLELCAKERLYHAQEAEQHQRKVNQIAAEYETLKQQKDIKAEVIVQTIEKIVERPVYQNVCLDKEGIDLINQLNPGSKKMKVLGLFILSVCLFGCAGKRPTPEPIVVVQPRIIPLEIPALLTIPCNDYPLLTGGTGKEIIQWGASVLRTGVDCKDRHDALSKIILDYTKDRESGVILKTD